MGQCRVKPLVVAVIISAGFAGSAAAQGPAPCSARVPPSVGAFVGWSSPYLEPATGLVEGGGSLNVDGGFQFAGRGEVPITGPLRLRLEGATARWDVRRTSYAADGFTATGVTSAGSISQNHFVALLGVRTGRAPVCATISAGGGLYSLAFDRDTDRHAGAALGAGMEFPTGGHGVIQVDAVLHLIATGESRLTTMSTVPNLSLLVGWAYRF